MDIISAGMTSPNLLFSLKHSHCSYVAALYVQVTDSETCRSEVGQKLRAAVSKYLAPVWMLSTDGKSFTVQSQRLTVQSQLWPH